jgi:hypothetical protein
MYAGTINEATTDLYTSTNYGASWTRVNYSGTYPNVFQKMVCSLDGTKIVTLGKPGTNTNVSYSSDSGASWTAVSLPVYPNSLGYPNDVTMDLNAQYITVTTQYYIFTYSTSDLSTPVTNTFLPTTATYTGIGIVGGNPNYMVVASADGDIYSSYNGGRTSWNKVGTANGLPTSPSFWYRVCVSNDGSKIIVISNDENGSIYLSDTTMIDTIDPGVTGPTGIAGYTGITGATGITGPGLYQESISGPYANYINLLNNKSPWGIYDAALWNTINIDTNALKSNAIVYYTFDLETQNGTQITDYSGTKTGTLSSSSMIQGSDYKVGNGAVSFNGIDQFVSLPSFVFPANGMSFCLWVNMKITSANRYSYTKIFEFSNTLNSGYKVNVMSYDFYLIILYI